MILFKTIHTLASVIVCSLFFKNCLHNCPKWPSWISKSYSHCGEGVKCVRHAGKPKNLQQLQHYQHNTEGCKQSLMLKEGKHGLCSCWNGMLCVNVIILSWGMQYIKYQKASLVENKIHFHSRELKRGIEQDLRGYKHNCAVNPLPFLHVDLCSVMHAWLSLGSWA